MALIATETPKARLVRERPVDAHGAPGPGGDWPRTTRVLPWMIAGFLVMLWIVPFDATTVPVSLPVDSLIDRFALFALMVVWAVVALGTAKYGPVRRRSPLNVAVFVFLFVCAASLVLNFSLVARSEEVGLSIKKLSLLLSFAAFFVIVATSVRSRELPRFMWLMLGLACVAAIGTIVEYRTGANHFYSLADKLLPGVTVGPEPPDPKFGRALVVGPTRHGLAATTILSMAIPIAVVGVLMTKDRTKRIIYALALGLVVAGAVATLRKTALVAPAGALLVLVALRPRDMIRLIPLGIALVFLVQVVSPGALSSIRYELTGGSELSNQARTSDYAAVNPDVMSRPLLGRGFGTYDPKIHKEKKVRERHRFLDNQLLMLLIEIGILGLLAYLAIAVITVATLAKTARSSDPARAGPALAVIAAVVAYLISNFLFDTLAFPHAPYLFFCLLGFGIVAAAPDVHRRLNGRATPSS